MEDKLLGIKTSLCASLLMWMISKCPECGFLQVSCVKIIKNPLVSHSIFASWNASELKPWEEISLRCQKRLEWKPLLPKTNSLPSLPSLGATSSWPQAGLTELSSQCQTQPGSLSPAHHFTSGKWSHAPFLASYFHPRIRESLQIHSPRGPSTGSIYFLWLRSCLSSCGRLHGEKGWVRALKPTGCDPYLSLSPLLTFCTV